MKASLLLLFVFLASEVGSAFDDSPAPLAPRRYDNLDELPDETFSAPNSGEKAFELIPTPDELKRIAKEKKEAELKKKWANINKKSKRKIAKKSKKKKRSIASKKSKKKSKVSAKRSVKKKAVVSKKKTDVRKRSVASKRKLKNQKKGKSRKNK